jgi:site-specific recombinase XerD
LATIPRARGLFLECQHQRQGYEDHGLVFCEPNGRPLARVNFYRHFLTLLGRVGLPRSRVHDIRHAFATTMLQLGESPKTGQTMLGHASTKTILDISRHSSTQQVVVLCRLTDYFLKILG